MWQKWKTEKVKFMMGTEAKIADALLKMTLAKQLSVTMQEEKMGKEKENWEVVEEVGGVRNL